MDIEGKSLRIGTAVIACAVALRLISGTGVGAAVQAMGQREIGAALLFLSTGRIIQKTELGLQLEASKSNPVETQPPKQNPEEPAVPAQLLTEEAAEVEIKNAAGVSVDIQELLSAPLDWKLTGENPTVLIIHTHGSESYENTEDYEASSAYRTLDENYNVVSIGDQLAERLEEAGIPVIHDRTLHDYPSYSGSYEQSRKSVQAYLAEYPSICIVLDIHRDAAEDEAGHQIDYTVHTEQGDAAQLMLVVGTNAGGLNHPNWQENLALAAKLQVLLERECDGICRPISLRTSRFNQDLCTGAVLVEVGAAGNTRQEALLAAEFLARGIIALANGTVTQ